MSLTFNPDEARKADKQSNIIRETGAYKGVITRAEKLVSKNNVKGVGFSLKTADGSTANYLDVYTTRADGSLLWGANLVQAVLACTRVKDAPEGEITFEKWDADVREMVKTTAVGYPALMGKPIGFVLQREIGTYEGRDTDKVLLVRVYDAATGLTSTEILDGKTKAEALPKFMASLAPVRDTRKKQAAAPTGNNPPPIEFDDIGDIRF